MKKILIIAALLPALAIALGACGETKGAGCAYAWIYLNGQTVVEGRVERLQEFRDGTLVVDIDGQRYHTHYSNAVIVEYPEGTEAAEKEVRPC